MNRGILVTEYAKLLPVKRADGQESLPTYEEIRAVYDRYYAKEKFVRVLEKGVCPETKWVEGSNYVDINFVIDERTGRIIMMQTVRRIIILSGEGRRGSGGTEYESDVRASGERRAGSGADVPVVRMI